MKLFFCLFITAALAACAPVKPIKEASLPPLSSVAANIKSGMDVNALNKALQGRQPDLKYSLPDGSIWEVSERINIAENHSVNANNLLIKFNKDGVVSESSYSFCFLPDQETVLGSSPATRCYQKHSFPFNKQVTYDAIKRLLIISHYQVDHSDAASELISATGTQNVPEDEDKMMFIKLSIVFSVIDTNTTEVIMSATFNVSEKQETWVQAGFAGVTLPIPLPFQKKEEWIGTGIVPPKFYMDFYDALSKLIASEYLPYKPIKQTLKTNTPAPVVNVPAVIPPPKAPVEADRFSTFTFSPQTPKATQNPESLDLNLEGPIDAEKNIKKTQQAHEQPEEQETEEEKDEENEDPFANLGGKPIDSK